MHTGAFKVVTSLEIGFRVLVVGFRVLGWMFGRTTQNVKSLEGLSTIQGSGFRAC